MRRPSADQFPAFFESVHGHAPHPWQRRLADTVLAGDGWPAVLDIPTGCGKTATLDIALFAHAVDPVQPRRIAFVVDRRLIVDQVSDRLDRIVAALERNDADEILTSVRSALRHGDTEGEATVQTSRLRGGVHDTDWARRPDLPAVVVSTVDQIGSRLLFRGYGASWRMWPIHAGLVGADTLVLLDEVHISRAFAQTLASIRDLQRGSTRPLRVVEMSATPVADPAVPPFRLEEADGQGPMVERILGAQKPAVIETVGAKRDLAGDAVAEAGARWAREQLRAHRSVAIIVNRVATAVRTTEALREDDRLGDADVLLLTGRMRPFDRRNVLRRVDEHGLRPGGGEAAGNVVVVSTQAIEVGADLDFGAMATELAPLDSMAQRFGRLDRRGERSAAGKPAAAAVLAARSIVEEKKRTPDPIYADRLHTTWDLLHRLPIDHELDVGIGGLRLLGELATSEELPTASPSADAPRLRSHHLDLLVQTHPTPAHDPDLGPFLHGLGSEPDTDVRIVWRADLTHDALTPGLGMPAGDLEWIESLLEKVPPHPDEMMSVPAGAARRWLRGQDPTPVADVTSVSVTEADSLGDRVPRPYLLWSPSGSCIRSGGTGLAPGSVVVVPASHGGMTLSTWDPTAMTAVDDIADNVAPATVEAAQTEAGGQKRLHEVLLGGPVPQPEHPDLTTVDGEATIRAWLESAPIEAAVAEEIRAVLDGAGVTVEAYPVAADAWRFVLSRPPGRRRSRIFDGSDSTNSFLGKIITLDRHLDDVGQRARAYAERAGIPATRLDDFDVAGRLHDLGKLDARFQRMLRSGPGGYAVEAPLAKSAATRFGTRAHWQATSYPRGLRHEAVSAAMIDAAPELVARAADVDLVRYLVASHHGHGRPFFDPQIDPAPVQVRGRVDDIEIDVTSRPPDEVVDARSGDLFWTLVRRYGHHELAWMEAVFRLADHRSSELLEAETT